MRFWLIALAFIGSLIALAFAADAYAAGPYLGTDLRMAAPDGPSVCCDDGRALDCLLERNSNCATFTGSTSITTARPSPVPCLRDGVWTEVGADVACIGPNGLESFPQTTNYVVNSTELSGWVLIGGAARTLMSDATGSFWRVTGAAGAGVEFVPAGTASGEVATATCELRGSSAVTVWASGSGVLPQYAIHTPTGGWVRYSAGGIATTSQPRVRVFLSGSAGSVDIRQCQLEKSPTPGRRCDSAASPRTCAADVHSVSTQGWPTTAGKISLRYAPLTATNASDRYLLDTRSSVTVAGQGFTLRVAASNGGIGVFVNGSAGSIFSGPLAWTACDSAAASCLGHFIEVEWVGSAFRIRRDGVQVLSSAASIAVSTRHTTATIGALVSGTLQAAGSIRLLSVEAL